MMTLSALNQFLKQHTPEETQRLNGVKKDYSQFPVLIRTLKICVLYFFQRKCFRVITTSLL